MDLKNIAVVCDVMKQDLEKIVKDRKIDNLDFIFMEQHLHNTPDLMRQKLQEKISSVDGNYDKIILGYGLCSNGVTEIVSDKHQIIIPKVHDCISLFLGSKEKYLEMFKKDPATYYFCKGWIEYGGDPYRGYLLWTGKEGQVPGQWIRSKEVYGSRRYDERTARLLIAEMMKNYKKIILINNNDIENIHRQYLDKMISFLNEVLQRELILEEIPGSLKFLEKIALLETDEKNFLSFDPGQKITQKDFLK
ncbi:MAG: DUF1638 domain-containing protein [Actinobacteria bacterium]|nr:DUF1638 domain-containing protein [Actinomycetota bacterium]